MSDSTAIRVADLSQNSVTPFDLQPDSEALQAIATELGLLGLRKLRFSGKISAQAKKDWALAGKLGATVVQPCVVTLEPVTTRIDTTVQRLFMAELPEIDDEEIEIPEDDSVEKLGNVIDPAADMLESLALALPLYPKKQDASLEQSVFAEPGIRPLEDEDTRPFAGLAGLRDSLKKRP